MDANYPLNQQVAAYRMVSTFTMHSDEDIETLLLRVSETCNGHSKAMARAIQSHTHNVGIICKGRISPLHTSSQHFN